MVSEKENKWYHLFQFHPSVLTCNSCQEKINLLTPDFSNQLPKILAKSIFLSLIVEFLKRLCIKPRRQPEFCRIIKVWHEKLPKYIFISPLYLSRLEKNIWEDMKLPKILERSWPSMCSSVRICILVLYEAVIQILIISFMQNVCNVKCLPMGQVWVNYEIYMTTSSY